LRRARRSCTAGLLGVACRDYEALITVLPSRGNNRDGRFVASQPCTLALADTGEKEGSLGLRRLLPEGADVARAR
jgi:hypothetical protein